MADKIKILKSSDFVHLHNHTQYSLLDGLTKIPDLIEFVKDQKMNSIAITDHGTLSGLIEFYKEAKAHDIKPILGIETYIAARKISDKEVMKDKNNFHLILLAKNNIGYHNIVKLSSIANIDGYYYKPRIDHDLLVKHSEGLICLSGCLGSELGSALLNQDVGSAIKIINWYKSIFKDNYYLEIQDHGHPDHPTYNQEQHAVNEAILKLSKELNVPVVVTADSHYLRETDQMAHEILLSVQTNAYLSDPKRFSLSNILLNVTKPKDIIKRWGKTNPEVISNTSQIAERCDVNIELGRTLIPKFDTPNKESEERYLTHLVYKGLAKRYLTGKYEKLTQENIKSKLPEDIQKRVEYELNVIHSMHFSGYFLIVQDFINWGKDKGIIFGPGRGSAAGSIVAYALNITEIDPIKHNLIFERFLNPNRVSMPDIDIDIQDSRRDEVIQYCVDKYGKDRVANIVTFGKMAARNAIRDVARVLEIPYSEADRLAKMIPPPIQGRNTPLKKIIKENKDLKSEYQNNANSKKIIDLAIQLEGTIRSHGVHAAGVVIAPTTVTDIVPIEMAQKGVITTQYSMNPIDELGLLKIDFLGLSNLTTINNALRIIRKVYDVKLELSSIPNDDQLTFEMLQRAETTGVFQLESTGMKRYLKELKPTLFEDIVAMVALYRPGPMSEIAKFIERKNDSSRIVYLHQSLKPILEETYGVMVYQEQITKLLQLIAGYSAGEADLVRKAIGKKNRTIMDNERPKFIAGCIKQGLSNNKAEELWALIQPFADYSFNKAHATCYGQIAYWTAYLKAHYPKVYLAALMTTDYDNSDRLAIEISEARHLGIEVLPPDINKSFVEFGVDARDNKIRYGFKAVKNVGLAVSEEIVEERNLNGKYKSLEDYLKRVSSKVTNRKTLESLIKVGAFDSFYNRRVLLNNIELLLEFANQGHRSKNSLQIDMFSTRDDQPSSNLSQKLKIDNQSLGEISDSKEFLTWERELLGIYLSDHPLQKYRDFIEKNCHLIKDSKSFALGRKYQICASVASIHTIVTKKNQPMAFVTIEDFSGDIELVMFPKVYDKYHKILGKDKVYLFDVTKGQSSSNGDSLILEELRELDDQTVSTKYDGPGAKANSDDLKEQNLYIKLEDISNHQLLLTIKSYLDQYQGKTSVVIVIGDNPKKQAIKLPGGIDSGNIKIINELKNIVGEKNLVLS